jgi:hypothetical protein
MGGREGHGQVVIKKPCDLAGHHFRHSHATRPPAPPSAWVVPRTICHVDQRTGHPWANSGHPLCFDSFGGEMRAKASKYEWNGWNGPNSLYSPVYKQEITGSLLNVPVSRRPRRTKALERREDFVRELLQSPPFREGIEVTWGHCNKETIRKEEKGKCQNPSWVFAVRADCPESTTLAK